MAFNNSPGRAEYTATAGQTVFTYVFKIYNTTDLKVYLTPAGQTPNDANDLLTETTDYTVVISGDEGGTVTLVAPASVNDSITLVRVLDIDRLIEYQTNGDLLAATLNNDQNYQTYLIADKESDNTRFLKLPESSQGVSTEMPPPEPLNFFQWNTTGDAIINVASLQADGFLWTAADVYTKTELQSGALDTRYYTETEIDAAVAERRKLYARETTTHDMQTDADYTLTSAQNKYGRIIISDTGALLTTARNIIVDASIREFIFKNETLFTIYVKMTTGAAVPVMSGDTQKLYSDGSNIISFSNGDHIKNQCTAWVNFNGSTGAILDSYNISSVTRTDVGDYTLTFSSQMDNLNYSVAGTGVRPANAESDFYLGLQGSTVTPIALASVKVGTKIGSNGASTDAAVATVMIFGGKD